MNILTLKRKGLNAKWIIREKKDLMFRPRHSIVTWSFTSFTPTDFINSIKRKDNII